MIEIFHERLFMLLECMLYTLRACWAAALWDEGWWMRRMWVMRGDEVGEKFHCEISHSTSSAACCEVSSAKAEKKKLTTRHATERASKWMASFSSMKWHNHLSTLPWHHQQTDKIVFFVLVSQGKNYIKKSSCLCELNESCPLNQPEPRLAYEWIDRNEWDSIRRTFQCELNDHPRDCHGIYQKSPEKIRNSSKMKKETSPSGRMIRMYERQVLCQLIRQRKKWN